MAGVERATVPEVDTEKSFPMEPHLEKTEAVCHQVLRAQLVAGNIDKAGKVAELMEKLMLI